MPGDAKVTQAEIVAGLRGLGLERGDVVLVHSSLSSLGWLEDGPESAVRALLEVVGPDGTVVVPTLVPALRGLRPLFDIEKSPSEMGRLTEEVRKWPGAIRSNHPTHSVAAVGRLAAEITADHEKASGPNSPWGPKALGFDTPWDRLRELNAWVLLLGVGFNRCTILHHAQARYKAAHENVTKTTPWPDFDFTRMGDRLESLGIVRSARIGNAECRLARAGEIVNTALEALETRPLEFFGPAPTKMTKWLETRATVEEHGRPRAAAFKVNIVPEPTDRLIGRPLYARGLIVDDPRGGRAIQILLDHIAMFHGEAMKIREAASRATGIPAESIMVTCTHTHYGYSHCFRPVEGYVEFIAEKAAAAAAEAMGRLEPVRAGWSTIDAPGINNNRSMYLKDGRAYTERWAMPSTWHIKEENKLHRGPADREVRLLVLERLDHSRLAVVGNFSCHNSAGLNAPEVQDDFFGVAMTLIEHAEGEGCVAMITPGTEGDQDPTAMIELGGIRDMAYAVRLGKRLAGYVFVAIADVPVHDVFSVGTGFQSVEVKIRDDWRSFVTPKIATSGLYQYADRKTMPAHVAALAIGEYALVGVPAELFTTPGRRIREHSPFVVTSAMSLTNGMVCYVAEAEAFFDASYIYGVHPDLPDMAEKGTDTVLVNAGLSALREAKAMATAGRAPAAV